jgi:hypothetical protein
MYLFICLHEPMYSFICMRLCIVSYEPMYLLFYLMMNSDLLCTIYIAET